jgi:hypothetical protein
VKEGVDISPRGLISPLGGRGEVKNGPQEVLYPGEWFRVYVPGCEISYETHF